LGIAEGHVFKRIAPLVKKSYGVDIREECGLSIKDLPNSTFFCGSTTNFAKSLKAKGEKIDFLFIDADHSKKAVAEDFYNFFDLITPHGMIVFHDTHPANQEMTSSGRCGDCYDIILQLQKDNLIDCEMMTIPLHPGLTLCRKRKKQLKWHETDL
jgi:predicted O-methyltransferase YrrM